MKLIKTKPVSEIERVISGLMFKTDRVTKQPIPVKLFPEYQPAIVTDLNTFIQSTIEHACKIHVACGGGKTILMFANTLLSLLNGAKRVVIVAPTIALINQLQDEFLDFLDNIPSHIFIGSAIENIRVLQMSCASNKQRMKDEVKDEANEEDIDEKEAQLTTVKAVEAAQSHKIKALITLDRKVITKYLYDATYNPTVFFVTYKSFKRDEKNNAPGFNEIAYNASAFIDITHFDEYHNMISQDIRMLWKTALKQYSKVCKKRVFWSASKKYGKQFDCRDIIFGNELADISTNQLRKWNRLVKELKIFTVRASEIKRLAAECASFLETKGIKNSKKFFKEAAVIITVMQHAMQFVTPHMMTFSSKVAFIEEMFANADFIQKLKTLIGTKDLYVQCMSAKTDTDSRNAAFEKFKSATNEVTLLMQHSIAKEGINVVNFNVAAICRGLCDIALQQAIGRITRVAPNKDTAYLYLYIDDAADDYKSKVISWIYKLYYQGLTQDDYTMEDVSEYRIGDPDQHGDNSFYNVTPIKYKFISPKVLINEAFNEVKDEMEEAKFNYEYEEFVKDVQLLNNNAEIISNQMVFDMLDFLSC